MKFKFDSHGWLSETSTLFGVAIIIGGMIEYLANVIGADALSGLLSAGVILLYPQSKGKQQQTTAWVTRIVAILSAVKGAQEAHEANIPSAVTLDSAPVSEGKSLKTFLGYVAVIGMIGSLAACGNQTNMRKAAFDTMSAYHVAATGAEAYLASGKVDDTVKAHIKTAAAAALTPLTALDASVSAGNSISTTELSTAESALAGLQSALTTAQGVTAVSN